MSDEEFMAVALEQARTAALAGEVPVGAAVVWRGRVIATGRNAPVYSHDPTAHAEILAITAAANYLGGKYLNDCRLYVTLEPCPMCAGALYWAQLGELHVGASDPKRGYLQCNSQMLHPKTKVSTGLMAKESEQLLLDFFQNLRKKSF